MLSLNPEPFSWALILSLSVFPRPFLGSENGSFLIGKPSSPPTEGTVCDDVMLTAAHQCHVHPAVSAAIPVAELDSRASLKKVFAEFDVI